MQIKTHQYSSKRKPGAMKRQKNTLKLGERNNTYLTHVHRLPQSIKSVEKESHSAGFYLYFQYSLHSADMSQVRVTPFSFFNLFFV